MQEKEGDPTMPKMAGESRVQQTFLRPEQNKFQSISPELSHFCLSQDLRTIFIASANLTSSIFVWELTTNCFQAKLDLPNCPIILNIKVANDNCHLLVVVSVSHLNHLLGSHKGLQPVLTDDQLEDTKAALRPCLPPLLALQD